MKQDLWNYEHLNSELSQVLAENNERSLLKLIHDNSFLLYDIYSRKYGIQPAFHEVSFGNEFRCDFAWLNDNSDGPEWVIVEIEKPNMRLFNKNGAPSAELNNAIHQVRSWERYFEQFPDEKRRLFGAVGRFRFVLVAGSKESWSTNEAVKWRLHHNKTDSIEIRSFDIFNRAMKILKQDPSELWSFKDNPTTLAPSQLKDYINNYEYLEYWIKRLNGN